RWLTDPLWQVVQRATFTDNPIVPLSRHKHAKPDLNHLDAEIYGMLKLRTVLRGEHLDDQVTWRNELSHLSARFHEIDKERERDYAQEVREKARSMGRAVPLLRQQSLLPRLDKRRRNKNGA